VVSYHRTRRSRSALAYGEHSTAAAATTSTGSYTTKRDATSGSERTSQRTSDRLEARVLAERSWGKAAVFQPRQGDPLDPASVEQAAEEFTAAILRLADGPESDRA
jgi:hypothetical protein